MLRRLLHQLIDLPDAFDALGADPRDLLGLLPPLQADAGPPVLVLDRFEEVMRGPDREARLSRVGRLLAETAARPSPGGGFVCQWILAYRQEYHGEVAHWLSDVLLESREAALDTLPRDLTHPDYLTEYALLPFGEPEPGARAREASEEIFLAAIEAPLALLDDDGAPRYPVRFADGEARKIAAAFADARLKRPRAPLTPELQVVLDHLLASAPPPGPDGIRWVSVGEDPEALIQSAMRDHLHRKLSDAFAHDTGERAQQRRTHALLALREVAEARLRGGGGVPAEALEDTFGAGEESVLAKLSGLLIKDRSEADETDLGYYYTIPHDRLADVVVEALDDRAERTRYRIDEHLFDLHRTVTLLVEARARGNTRATALRDEDYQRVREHRAALPWSQARKDWWRECEETHARRLREREAAARWRLGLLVMILALLAATGAAAYIVYLPKVYLAEIRRAPSYSEAVRAYVGLYRFPGHADAAEEAVSRWMVAWGLSASMRGKPEEALLWRLRALELREDEHNRREIAYLISLVEANKEKRFAGGIPASGDDHVSPTDDGTQVLVARSQGDAVVVRLWDAESGGPVSDELTVDKSSPWAPWAPRVRGAGAAVVVAVGRRVMTLNRATGDRMCEDLPLEPDEPVSSLDLSADGRTLAMASLKVVRRWDLGTCKQVGAGMAHDENVTNVELSPAGDRLMTITAGGAHLWNTASSKVLQPWSDVQHTRKRRFVTSGAFATLHSPEGILVVSAANGTLICEVPASGAAADVSPDGRWIITVDSAAGARSWRVESDHKCSALGSPVLLDRTDGTPIFAEEGRVAVVIGREWAHFLAATEAGLEPLASRRIEGKVEGALRVDPSAGRVRLLATTNSHFPTALTWYATKMVDRDPPERGAHGEPSSLLEKWQGELKLRFVRHGLVDKR
jgi:hypothetical protein